MAPARRTGFFVAAESSRIRRRLAATSQPVPCRVIDAELLDDLEARLIGADVGVEATSSILEKLRASVARRELTDADALVAALRAQLIAIVRPAAVPLVVDRKRRPYVIMVVGVNGSGKTTSIGKLATRLTAAGHTVMLAAGDTFRAAASEQLDIWARRSGAEIVQQAPGADPGAVIFDALRSAQARGVDVVIADTAGRLHSQSHLMEELKKIRRVIQRVCAAPARSVVLRQPVRTVARPQSSRVADRPSDKSRHALEASHAIARILQLPITSSLVESARLREFNAERLWRRVGPARLVKCR